MDQKTYSIYRKGGDFDVVLQGIKNVSGLISKYHSSLKLEIQFLVNRYNESQIPFATKFANKMNAGPET